MSQRSNRPQRMTAEQKAQKEDEFIEALQQVLGGPILPWQRETILYIRSTSLSGRPVDMELVKNSVRNRDAISRDLRSRS